MNKRILKVFFGCISIMTVCTAMTGCSWKNNEEKLQKEEIEKVEEIKNFTYTTEDGTRVNISEKITNETKYLDSLEFKNISITETGNITHIEADVYNDLDVMLTEKEVTIILLNQKNEEIKRINAYVGSIPAKASVKLKANVTLDYTNVYDIKFVEKSK